MITSQIRKKVAADSGVLAKVPANRVFIGMAQREAERPYIVIHRIDTPPAATTLDGSSALRDGEFQFDQYEDNQPDAEQLAGIVEKALQNFGGTLADGSTIQFTETTASGNDYFEVGGTSFIFRSFFRMKAFYTEA